MGDLAFLEDYLATPEQVAEAPTGGIEQLLNAPLEAPDTKAAPVQVIPGEKAEESIEKAKNKKNFLQAASGAKSKTEKTLGAVVPDIGDFPKPPSGGMGLLIFIALLVVFAITPVAGQTGLTRLNLLWQAALGNYTYQGAEGSATQDTTVQHAIEQSLANYSLIQGGLY